MTMNKIYKSNNYNYLFNYETGFFARWGKDQKDGPIKAPAPEILDMEVSTICHGLGKPCTFCYKSNTGVGQNMSFETFKIILHKMPVNLTQIAFGIGDIDSNPDLFKMFDYCRNNDYNKVVPNVTTNGYNLTDDLADKLAKYCGAVAVSRYSPKEVCYNAVERLTARGMKQINIHQLVSMETLKNCLETIEDIKNDKRLSKLNAIVFLTLKPKGNRNTFTLVNDEAYRKIIDKCLEYKINFGFDSCSANRFMRIIKGHKNESTFAQVSEPCESSLFSCYINVEGKYFPCSFSEDEEDWKEGLDVVNCKDFIKDIWTHKKTLKFQEKLLNNRRSCPLFRID